LCELLAFGPFFVRSMPFSWERLRPFLTRPGSIYFHRVLHIGALARRFVAI
jgi:hypothetical protein